MLKRMLSKKETSDKIIILIENNPEYISIFEEAASKMNAKFKIFKEDSEAWKFVLSNHNYISLVVSCKLSANINGLVFLSKLKSHMSLRSIPVIMQSIDKKAGKEREAISLGARFYMKKPFNSRKLYSLMKTTVRKPIAVSNYNQ